MIEEINLLNDYLDGLKYVDIKKKYNCSNKLIRNILIRNNITPNRQNTNSVRSTLNKSLQEDICNDYVKGDSTKKIADNRCLSKTRVNRVLKANCLLRTISVSKRKYKINESSFSVFTPDCAYWIGFIMADGNVCHNGNSRILQITLNEKDKDHLKKLCLFLGTNKPIYSRISKRKYKERVLISKEVTLSINSSKICESLKVFGVVPRKSHIAKACNECISSPDFWRGVIDGDGSIELNNGKQLKISLVGSKQIVEQFADFVENNLGKRYSISKCRTIYKTNVYGEYALRLSKILYYPDRPYLERKFNKVLSFWS